MAVGLGQRVGGSWHLPVLAATIAQLETRMETRTLSEVERRKLISALRSNALDNHAILMDRKTTRFVGTSDEVTDDEVITAIKSVPCHY